MPKFSLRRTLQSNSMADPLGFSKTQRILLLTDLSPLLRNPNPQPYITSVLAAAKILLTFESLSSSLFSFKLFFSSLSPLRSSSTLHRLLPKPPTSLSFNNSSETLSSLSSLLASLSIPTQLTTSSPPSIASHTACSLLQLVHDYDWDSQLENPPGISGDFPGIRSNLIVLFSPACCSTKCLAEFMCVDDSDECLSCFDKFNVKFCGLFGGVNDAFIARDIHFCWIDVNYESKGMGMKDEGNEGAEQLGAFKSGIESFGWGFCSTDSIILGSALVSFGLIYPNIGVSLMVSNSCDLSKRTNGQLSLEILDVSGKPLECKCCDLELVHLNPFPDYRSDDILRNLEFRGSESEGSNHGETFWRTFNDGKLKLQVKAVVRCMKGKKNEESSSNQFLVRQLSAESGTSRNKCSEYCSADRVLELLAKETNEFFPTNSIPIWQILLNFLHRGDFLALLSISNSGGSLCTGILKPFTVHSAFLSIRDDGHSLVDKIGGSNLVKIEDLISEGKVEMNSEEPIASRIGTSPARNCLYLDDGKRRKSTKISYQELTWSSFCKAAFEFSEMELAEVYFAADFKKPKKLKFLKCWMKQVKKCSHYRLSVPGGSKSHHHVEKEIEEILTGSCQESEQLLSEHFPTDLSRQQEDTALVSCSETSESFLCSLPKKIQQGLESEGVELQILAERLVNSSIHWLHQKHKLGNHIESQIPKTNPEDSCSTTVAELIKLLLKDPMSLKEKRKDSDSSYQAANLSSTLGHVVREYELQIFLRMEILQSEVVESMEELMNQKLVKQICSLLEIIQFLVEGGLHGHVSLYDYVERTIKTRYSHNLEDVVNRIYNQMDLLPFGEENETQVLLFNSEDSNHSWRDKQERHGFAETSKVYESVSAEDESSQPLENVDEIHQGTGKDKHHKKLSEARERRERAKRFGSFTSWIPDLQRVWAPKQPKVVKSKPDSFQKESKRKKQRRASYSVVCETPMTANCQGGEEGDGNENRGSNSSRSVSKALFQDNR